MKFKRDGDPFLPGYRVERDGRVLGWVTNMGDGWIVNCKPDGCWCHLAMYETRRDAAAILSEAMPA